MPNDQAVTETLTTSGTSTGTYFMPGPRATAEEFAAFEAQHRRGPFFRLSYVREGVDPSSPQKLLTGTLHYLSVALLGTALVGLARTRAFASTAGVVFVAGLLGSNLITVGDPVWFHLPWDYTRGVLLYEIVAWLLLGLTLAAICPKRPAVEPQMARRGGGLTREP